MNASNILAVLGILATAVFGIWGLVIVIRRQYPGQLTYVKQPYIGLFDSIVKNLPELAVLYNNAPVGEGLVLVNGAILNTGSIDITDSMVEQKLAFALPSDFRWLTAKIVGTSGNVKASLDIQANSLVLSTGLFRCNESIKFQAIAEAPIHRAGDTGRRETPIEDRLDKSISITHRIADTQEVASIQLPNSRLAKRRERLLFFMALVITVFVGITVLGMIFEGIPGEMHFIVTDSSGIQHEVRTTLRLDGIMTLKGVEDDFRREVTVNEFFAQGHLNAKVALLHEVKTLLIPFLSLYVLFPWVLCLHSYRQRRRADRFRRLLGIQANKKAKEKEEA